MKNHVFFFRALNSLHSQVFQLIEQDLATENALQQAASLLQERKKLLKLALEAGLSGQDVEISGEP